MCCPVLSLRVLLVLDLHVCLLACLGSLGGRRTTQLVRARRLLLNPNTLLASWAFQETLALLHGAVDLGILVGASRVFARGGLVAWLVWGHGSMVTADRWSLVGKVLPLVTRREEGGGGEGTIRSGLIKYTPRLSIADG